MSDSDRELLEYAAKAAGYEVNLLSEDPNSWYVYDDRPTYGKQRYVWNPLTDDGDALRLAVRLKIGVGFVSGAAFADAHERIYRVIDVDMNGAARRAIVRAAAEIGKAMP